MNADGSSVAHKPETNSLKILDLEPPPSNHEAEIIEGLTAENKYLSPKFFYDVKGSELFDEITQLDEYYLTRTEKQILTDNAHAIADAIGHGHVLIEPGSGSSEKIRLLLNNLRPSYYVPMEISSDYMLDVANALQREYPDLNLLCVKTDYMFKLPDTEQLPEGRKVAFFPGSTIGNFPPADAIDFLRRMRKMVGTDGGLLIGIDLKKAPAIIHAAYNDAKGVTAKFNLNSLDNINGLMNGTFDTTNFQHEAIYNEKEGRVTMHLISTEEQEIELSGNTIHFSKSESVHTESCYKFSLNDAKKLLIEAGFEYQLHWTDERSYFAEIYAKAI